MKPRAVRAATLLAAFPLIALTLVAAGSKAADLASSRTLESLTHPIVGSAVGHTVHISPGGRRLTRSGGRSLVPPVPDPITSSGQQPLLSRSVTNQRDALEQTRAPSTGVKLGTGFQGLPVTANGGPRKWVIPADPNGAIGNGYYVEMVNEVFAVWSVPSPGTHHMVFGPTRMQKLFNLSTQGLCENHDSGDPVVLYDAAADRFLISELAINLNQRIFYDCIAISMSGNPATGNWYVYAFKYPKPVLNDYPKFGVWPDGYYASFNQYAITSTGQFKWAGAGAIAYDRTNMLLGNTANYVYFNLYNISTRLGGMLPTTLVGPTPPPVGTPNIFGQWDADDKYYPFKNDQIELWGFHVDFTTPSHSTFTKLPSTPIAVANFNPWICGAGKQRCVPQKGSPIKLDTLLYESMFPQIYRSDGTNQHIVFTHSVHSNLGTSGVRWYDLVEPTSTTDGSGWTAGDQGTYAPDAKYRWMGSAAIDAAGDIAIGFSISSAHIHPAIGVAGRLAADPLHEMTSASTVYHGAGSETSKYGRWGDYSSMWVDPRDDCTFWYTSMYYKATSGFRWGTWVQSFTLPSSTC